MSRQPRSFVVALTTFLLLLSPLAALPAQAAPNVHANQKAHTATQKLARTNAKLGLPGEGKTVPRPGGKATASSLPSATPDVAAAASGAVVQFAEMALSEDVGVVGVTFDQPVADDVAVYVRQVDAGTPEAWTALEMDTSSETATAPLSTEPIVVSGAGSVQVATLSATPMTATLALSTSATVAADTTTSDLAWTDPEIRSRSSWGARPPKYEYTKGIVTGAMIHHTAGTNNYTADQVPAILRSIQAFHMDTRDWNDMAYNVLVDKFGRAWEGRGGGVDKAIAGGHAWGITNNRVFGISIMGDYETVQPSAAALDTVSKVIAWKFRIHGVDPNSKTWGSGGQDGGDITLNALSGHRDENATACPGRYVYAQFSTIKTKVVNYLATKYPNTGLEGYRPGNLISDERFFDGAGLTEQEARDFIAAKGSTCVPGADGTPCLKDYVVTIPATPATQYCAALPGGETDAAGVITQVGQVCGINPEVMLVLIQKESGLVGASRPTATMYSKATGAGCPDFMACDAGLASFFGQVYGAAEKFQKYKANPGAYPVKANGTPQTVRYSPEPSCGSATFVVENQATAGLYTYTPFTANAAAINAVSGAGDACSAYGNRNFYRLLSTWFPTAPSSWTAALPEPASTVTPQWGAIWAKANALGAAATGAEKGPVVDAGNGWFSKPYANLAILWAPATGPGVVSFKDTWGTADDTYTVPSTPGVAYAVNGTVQGPGTYPALGTVTVTATPQVGYALTGTTSWSKAFTGVASPTPTPTSTPAPTPTPTPMVSPTPTPSVLAPSTVVVRRWFTPIDKDWVTIPEASGQPSAAQLRSWGYTIGSDPQYRASLTGGTGMVAVYRWWHPKDHDWVDMPASGTPDATMVRYGYTIKTFQFHLWTTGGSGRVAVNRWFHPKDNEWVTIRQDEISDATLKSWGYGAKTLVGYAPLA